MNNINDSYALYLIINETLNMSPGKLAAQCAHASEMISEHYYQNLQSDLSKIGSVPKQLENQLVHNYREWKTHSNRRKIVLKADSKEWDKIKQEYAGFYVLVIDAGYTEIESGSETVIGLYPMLKSQASKTLKRLQLL